MADMNGGEFSDDRAVEIVGDESETSVLMVKIAALEQENLQLGHEKDVIEKKIGELKKAIDEAGIEKEKLLQELTESKAEIKTLGSVAARAAELEGHVSKLQHDLVSTTGDLEEVTGELAAVKSTLEGFKKRDGEKVTEFEAVVAERDLLIEKLGQVEAKENQYLSEMNEKEKEIGSLRAKVEELKVEAGKSGDVKKDGDNLKSELEATIVTLERKVKLLEKVISGFEKEPETTVVEGKSGGLLNGEINFGWQVIAASAIGFGLLGVVCYVHQAKRT